MEYTIVLATGNRNKVKEMRALLAGSGIEIKTLNDFASVPEAVEDGTTFAENAFKKGVHYAMTLGLPCLADDSGLVVNALDGRPGVYSARYAGEHANDDDNCRKLLGEMDGVADRSAAFVCALSLTAPSGGSLAWQGMCEGRILTEKRGDAGFGYDPLFYFEQFGKTFAEAGLDEKGRVSHRGKALAAFLADIDKVKVWLVSQR